MGPDQALPLPAEFTDVDTYVDSLLNFVTSSWLLQTLCGGVHILDFFTRTEDLYSSLLSQEWRDWFKSRDMTDILDLFMRENLAQFNEPRSGGLDTMPSESSTWRGGPPPPHSLVQYLKDVRAHLLDRRFPTPNSGMTVQKSSIARHVAVGMKVKKVHEVDNFARYVDRLTSDIANTSSRKISHLVDFGSGQNYLGRALAAQPYSKHIVAVESKQHNIEGAKHIDVLAKLVEKPLVMRNKKAYRAGLQNNDNRGQKRDSDGSGNSPSARLANKPGSSVADSGEYDECQETAERTTVTTTLQVYTDGQGSVQYIEHRITDGSLLPVVEQVIDTSRVQNTTITPQSSVVAQASSPQDLPKSTEPSLMVISLHSCGNLVHHGLRSLFLNPSVNAVAMVGCCYNLVTERLGPPTYKLPTLRPNHPRLVSTSNAFDPHGFPMSERLVNFPLPAHPESNSANGLNGTRPTGVRLNITSRMMAVQAPQNWGKEDSDLFFTRHFYRALLQRIFLDRGVVSAPIDDDDVVGGSVSAAGHTSKVNWTPPNGSAPGVELNGRTTPLTIGTLRRFCYENFVSYVRGALAKLTTPNSFCAVDPAFISEKMGSLSDEEILDYETQYLERKKDLSVIWSLMAFSAGVIEAVIVVDRWLWLKEQKELEHAWVEPVFDFKLSPRNLVIVGIKK